MRILVTGGAGFIGSNFIRFWREHYPDDTIVNLDKLTYAGNLKNLRDLEGDPHYIFIRGDICDPKAVQTAMKGVDIVVHFAAESHVDRSIVDPASFMMTNVIGTQVLLDAASRYKVSRFHHISTDEVFGHLREDDPPFHEKSPHCPRSPYAASKAAAEHLVRAYGTTYGLPITISNASNNYGPYQYPEKVVPLFITNLLEKKKVPLYGSGKNIRDWMYVEDHCRGIAAVLEKGKVGETYCFGGNYELSNIELTEKILTSMGHGKEMIERVKDRPGHDFRYAMNTSKVERELEWKPWYSFDEGLEKTIGWYKKNKSWWKPLKK